jgi:hypothetical protein
MKKTLFIVIFFINSFCLFSQSPFVKFEINEGLGIQLITNKDNLSSSELTRVKDISIGNSFDIGTTLLYKKHFGLGVSYIRFNSSASGENYQDYLTVSSFTIDPTFFQPIGEKSLHYFFISVGIGFWKKDYNKTNYSTTNEFITKGLSISPKAGMNFKLYKGLYFNTNIGFPVGRIRSSTFPTQSVYFYYNERMEFKIGISVYVSSN